MRTLLYGVVISVSTTNISICINNDTLQHIETFVYHSGDEDEDEVLVMMMVVVVIIMMLTIMLC